MYNGGIDHDVMCYIANDNKDQTIFKLEVVLFFHVWAFWSCKAVIYKGDGTSAVNRRYCGEARFI